MAHTVNTDCVGALSGKTLGHRFADRASRAVDDGWTPGAGPLPAAIYATASRAAYIDPKVSAKAPTTRVRTSSGDWRSIHASRLSGPTGRQTAVVVESAQPMQMASLDLDPHGLTPAQSRVAALVLQGPLHQANRERAPHLRIYGARHLGAVFDKFGIGSRRELVATLLCPSHCSHSLCKCATTCRPGHRPLDEPQPA